MHADKTGEEERINTTARTVIGVEEDRYKVIVELWRRGARGGAGAVLRQISGIIIHSTGFGVQNPAM
jgi:hypothetical protein